MDSRIGSAPANVSTQPASNLFCRWLGMLPEECRRCDYETGRAEPTLLGVVIYKSLLNGRKRLAMVQAFNGCDLVGLGVDREYGARIRGLAIEQHRAGATRTTVTHTLGAGQVKVVAEDIE